MCTLPKCGSAQQSVKLCVLRGFLKTRLLGLRSTEPRHLHQNGQYFQLGFGSVDPELKFVFDYLPRDVGISGHADPLRPRTVCLLLVRVKHTFL